jgi:hypothetical protein
MQVIDGGLVAEIVTKYEVHIYDEDNQKIINMNFDSYAKAIKFVNEYLESKKKGD